MAESLVIRIIVRTQNTVANPARLSIRWRNGFASRRSPLADKRCKKNRNKIILPISQKNRRAIGHQSVLRRFSEKHSLKGWGQRIDASMCLIRGHKSISRTRFLNLYENSKEQEVGEYSKMVCAYYQTLLNFKISSHSEKHRRPWRWRRRNETPEASFEARRQGQEKYRREYVKLWCL